MLSNLRRDIDNMNRVLLGDFEIWKCLKMGILRGFEIYFGVKMGGLVWGIFVFGGASRDFGGCMDTWYSGTLFG